MLKFNPLTGLFDLVSDPATSTVSGTITITGDLGGTASSPQVVGTHLASPLPLIQGGTGADLHTIAKGGLVSGTGAGTVGITAVGGDGTVLSADSGSAGGVKWIAAGGTGTVTSVSVASANGFSGTVANATTTPAITIIAGAITPTSVNGITLSGSGTPTLAVTGTSSISGANTGDQTITLTGAVTGSGTGSFATTLATPGTLTVSSTNSNVTAHTHAITSSSAPGAAASILATDSSGIIGSAGTRIVKGWFIGLTVTNAIAGSITGSAAKWTTARNLAGNSVDGSADVPFANKFIVQGTTDTGLSAAQFMGALGTGIVKNTTTTGVLSIATAPDFPTLNQNTSGTAAGLSATLVPASGGTGVANNNASTITISGSFGLTLTLTNTTSLTLPTSGTLATLAGAETLTNKLLSDAFMGNGFQSQSALVENVTLLASSNFVYDAILEIGASNTLEVPATSTLEIEAYVDQAYLNNNPITAPVEATVFQSLSATKQSIVLLSATDFQVTGFVEIGVGYTLEIPLNSTLEIAAYGGGVINTDAAPPNMIGISRLNAVETADLFTGGGITAATWTDFKANQNFTVDNPTSIILISLQGVAQVTSTTTSTNVASRIIIDSATTALTYYIGGANAQTANQAGNPFAGNGFTMITGLLPGVHTIKTQVYSSGANSIVFCRPSTQPNIEFFTTSVLELKR